MKRSEQDIRFQWDLTKIYPDTAAWEAAMQEAEAALAPLAAIPGTLGTSKEAFKKGLDTVYASMFKVELPYTYAFLKKTEDGSVAENQEMAARSESLLVKFSAATAFLNPEILAIPAEKLDEWMQDEALAVYTARQEALFAPIRAWHEAHPSHALVFRGFTGAVTEANMPLLDECAYIILPTNDVKTLDEMSFSALTAVSVAGVPADRLIVTAQTCLLYTSDAADEL